MRSIPLLSFTAAAAAVILLLTMQTAHAQQNGTSACASREQEGHVACIRKFTRDALPPSLCVSVAVDFFVMSKCPDAVFCEQTFAAGLAPVISIVELSLNYIANESAPNSGAFVCRHGPGECTGDMQQLCAKELDTSQPAEGDLPVWFQFALCQSNSSASIPANGQACAEEVGLDWNNMQYCVSNNGPELLAASIQRRHAGNANESISCTVELDRQFWCQHNGGWVGCSEGNTADDLTAAICNRYAGQKKPIACEPVATHADEQASEEKDAWELAAESFSDRVNAQAVEAQV